MKRIISLLLGSILAFGTTAFGQNVKIGKDYYGPDDNGVYTLQLEAYVTGSVTVETHPADFVLILDYSSSMRNDIGNLRTAVANFVTKVQNSNSSVIPDANGGHRIALVLFAGQVYKGTITWTGQSNGATNGTKSYSADLNKFLDVSTLEVGTNSVTSNNVDLLGYAIQSGTNSPAAMEAAKDVLSGSTSAYSTNPDRARFVVFFTDGEPYIGSTNRTPAMRSTVQSAADIKTSTTYQATIYTVGLFNGHTTADQVTTYMAYTSSDYPTYVQVPEAYSGGPWVNVSGNKSIIVSNSTQLDKIFDDIFEATGGSYSAAASSSVLVDIVASSFYIPTNASLGTTQVYSVPCTINSASDLMKFEEDRTKWNNITSSVTLNVDPSTGEVTVEGYDYGEEWCGWDASKKNEAGVVVGGPHGHKLVLEIPIMAEPEAVGGPNVATNAPGSKLVVKDKTGAEIGSYEFVSPAISLPVNIHIMKKGLGNGESAKFSLYRTELPVTTSSTWEYVTSVFVTNGDSSPTEVAKDDNKSYPITYVRGLPSAIKKTVDEEDVLYKYVYKIIEDDWSWSYDFSKVTGIGPGTTASPSGVAVTVTDKEGVTSDLFMTNPIIFWDEKESDVDQRVRHAESKATNIFLGSGQVIYDDSKKNTGTGRKD